MADKLLRQVALVSESQRVQARDLARVAAALQKQATRDLVQFWDVKATVDHFPALEDVPIGYWPVMIMDDINQPGAAGVHLDKNGQPFALVSADDSRDVWSLTTSHEMIEMLVDPFGNRVVACDSPKSDQGRAEILVEACDPSEDAKFAYTVNGILVSDFYSPRYFDPVAAPGVRYSFTGAIEEPRQVLRGGYVSWRDVATDIWWQETWFDGDQPSFRSLGKLDARNGSLRSQIDRLTYDHTRAAQAAGMQAALAAGVQASTQDAAMAARAASLRQQIEELTGGPEGRPGLAAGMGPALAEEARLGRPRAAQRPRTVGLRHAPNIHGNAQSRH